MYQVVFEVCGKPASIHISGKDLDFPDRKVERHYCRDHAAPEIQPKLPGPEDEARHIEEKIAQIEAREIDPAQKAEFRQELEKFVKDIRAGRKRFGEAD